MGTKTIGVTEEVYDRLAAEKRDDESFTDTLARLVDETTADWRRGFGRYADAGGDEFERAVGDSRTDRAAGLAASHAETLEKLGFELDADGNVISTPGTDESR
jgi:predicted CopG family antitoxin